MKDEATKPFSFRFKPSLMQDVQRVAKATGRTRTSEIAHALQQHVRRVSRQKNLSAR